MKLASFEAMVRALNDAGVRFIVVGGVAVATHGYLRQTKDIDLVIELQPDNTIRGLRALQTLGYFPRVPVTPEQFADAALREGWIRDKQMVVLNLFSDSHRQTPIDVFVREPFSFCDEYEAALIDEVAPGLPVRIVSLATLLRMKAEAGRPDDLRDIEQLKLRGDNPQ
jgi:predicted nucleotidyltransferase